MKTLAALLLFLTPATACADLVYALGNSLTVDAQPWQWSDATLAYCGQTMPWIAANPSSPCYSHGPANRWDTDLAATQYDTLVLQPYEGPTLAEDVTAIMTIVALQPDADIVLHTGFLRMSQFETNYPGRATHIENLVTTLRTEMPDREIRSNYVLQAYHQVFLDVAAGVGPVLDVGQLYRDDIHASYNQGGTIGERAIVPGYPIGRAINQAMMLKALGRPQVMSDPYILGLTSVPEPSAFLFVGLLACIALAIGKRKIDRFSGTEVPMGSVNDQSVIGASQSKDVSGTTEIASGKIGSD